MINIDDKTRRLSQATIVVGYKQENKAESIEFKIPNYLKEYGKKICFKTKDGKVFSKLFDNTTSNIFTFTRTETQYGELDATIQFFKTQNEDMIVYKTSMLHIIFNETINCEDEVQPDEPKIPILESLIETVTDLNNTITENEETRNNNENTRISNENSRIANETQRDIYYTGIQNKVNNGEFNGATYLPNVDAEGNITWTNDKGLENPSSQNIRGPQGVAGPQGEAFKIKKTYPSIEAMQNDFDNMEVGDYAMIATSIELEDNAKLYSRTETEWVFITDFSGATGIQGPQGIQGIQGIQGERGIGISKLEVIDGSLWVTLTDSTTQNAGLIITDEVKQWLVTEITNNAESTFNQYYDTKVSEFNENVQAKLDEYNANAEALANKVVELETENTSLKNQIPSGEATGNPIHLSDSSDMKCEIVPIGESKEKLYLPEEYTQLEYIESSGTQYIDTGFKPNQNSGVETLVETYDTNVLYNNPFGVRNENREQFFVGIQTNPQGNNNSETWFLRYGTQHYISEFGIKYGQNHIIVNKNIYTINGDSYTFNSTIFQSSNNMYLFACNNNGETNDREMRGKMYYFKLYDNDVLIRNMIPCIRKSDNVVGMYDTVNNLFYENSGTGNFIAGPELTKNPDYPSEIVTVGSNVNLCDNSRILVGIDPQNSSEKDFRTSDYIKVEYGKNYVASLYNEKKVRIGNLVYQTWNKNFEKLQQITTNTIKITNQDIAYVTVRNYKNDAEEIKNKFYYKFEESLIATPYSPFGQGSVEIDACNKNLFDKNNINKLVGYVDGNGNFNIGNLNTRTLYISCMANTDYVVSRVSGQYFKIASFSEEIKNTVHMINGITNKPTASKLSINTGDNAKYLAVTYYNSSKDTLTEQEILNSIQIELGSEATDYIPHESYTKVLPIQQEMLEGDYISDKEYHNWEKIDSYNGEEITTDFKSTTGELTTGATVYYKLAEPKGLELTEEQKAVLNSFYTYKNVTNISMSGIGTLKVNYKKDLETMFNNIIKQIPSSTSDTTET